ncbi:hypothetical protein AAHC03_013799 [Spirometra sp. Aus1]
MFLEHLQTVTPQRGQLQMHWTKSERKLKLAVREHPGLHRGPLDLQSNTLPLSYAAVTNATRDLTMLTNSSVLRSLAKCPDRHLTRQPTL